MDCVIRKACISDAEFIYKILYEFSEKRILLPRSYNQIYENIRDFFICETMEKVKAGCAALHIFWKDLAEIRSLAVKEEYQRRGYGKKLVLSCLNEALMLGINRVFALTYQVEFFESLNFKQIPKETLPQKIWADCLNCVKYPECDEVSLIWEKSAK